VGCAEAAWNKEKEKAEQGGWAWHWASVGRELEMEMGQAGCSDAIMGKKIKEAKWANGLQLGLRAEKNWAW
jgi:hypothetical protein